MQGARQGKGHNARVIFGGGGGGCSRGGRKKNSPYEKSVPFKAIQLAGDDWGTPGLRDQHFAIPQLVHAGQG